MKSFPPRERSARILIVDDEPHNRQLLEVMLAPEAYSVVSVESGEEALATISEIPPDLILLDVMMPGMDGYQVAAQVKANAATKNIPIIMVTALDDRSARMRGLTAGAEEFISKPVDRSEMCVRIRNLLRLKAYGEYHDRYGQMLEGQVGSRTAELVESERLYRSTFDAAPVGIVHVGLDGHWLRVNQRLCELLGYSREELQTRAVQKLIRSEEDLEHEAESFRLLVAGAMDRRVIDEQRLQRRDGSSLWARVNVSVFRDLQGRPRHFISVLEDITERRTLESQVRQASKLEAIGGLASGVAHDFNNLLSVILSYSELLAEGVSENDPMHADLDEIKAAGMRAVDLTRQLLAFGRKQVLQPKVVDLAEVVGGMTKMLRRLIGEDVELAAGGASAVGKIMVDPGQLEQVIMNLSVNARDAMPDGGKLTIETTEIDLDQAFAAEHVGVKAGRHVMLSVTDTGTGMDLQTQARMYEPFFTTKAAGKGTGLGLATVFGIVRQSGGTIWVDSQLRKGTTFKVYFPLIQEPSGAAFSRAPLERRTLRGMETVLLVEDEESVRTLARTILRKYGYNVLEAQSAGDACLVSEQHHAPIHLLLTDVVMPRMSGRALAERLAGTRPEMKVLYMSGYTDDEVMRHGILDSSLNFIQKPITPEILARKVREVLGAVLTR